MYKSRARLALLLIFLISAIGAWYTSRIGFDYDFEKFFPLGDKDLDFYLEYREQFENDNDYLLIGLENSSGIFHPDFLGRVDSLTRLIQRLPQVDQVLSPTNVKQPIHGPMGWLTLPYLHWKEPERLPEDSVKIYNNNDLVGQFFSEDGKSICLVIKHRQGIKKAAADSLMSNIEEQLALLQLNDVHLAGKARAQPTYLELIENELLVFLSASVVLIVLFLALTYRALWAVVVPLLVVGLAGVWVLGFMAAVKKPLDIMMVLLPTIIFVVGMSDVVHILTRYIEELRQGKNKIASLLTSFKEVGLATLLTSLTTAIGFLTLMTSSIRPIRDFGVYTALGVFIAFALAFSLLPSILLFLPKPQIAVDPHRKRRWQLILGKVFSLTLRNRKLVLWGSFLLVIFSVVGIQKLEVNTFLIDDIPRSHPLRADFLFFDKHFGGSRPFELAVEIRDPRKTIFDHEVLQEMEKVEGYLTHDYGTSQLYSPVRMVKTTYQATNGGSYKYYNLPPDSLEMSKLDRFLRTAGRMPGFNRIIGEDHRSARITGRMGDIGSSITNAKSKALMTFINSSVDTTLVNFRITGTSLLIDKNNEYLVNNMVTGLAIAFGVVALIAGLMFRSLRMILITLIPNIIPLLLVAGIMGVFGITLKLTTSVIFTVAFGIAVDDTIHFISKLRLELGKGRSRLYAIKRTYFSTGKAIVITTLILASGFLTLLLSSFGGTFYIGLFVSLTLIFALVVDLTLLPVLIVLFYKP